MRTTAEPIEPRSAEQYLDGPAASALLEVRRETLYAYVSRGLIRSVKQAGSKQHLYARDDIERLRGRSKARAGHGAVAASAMNWGEPIIPTAITQITPLGPCYRGQYATDLARAGTSFEAVSELLWSGLVGERELVWPAQPLPPELGRFTRSVTHVWPHDQLLEIFAIATLTLGLTRGGIEERVRGGRSADAARQVLQMLTGCFGLIGARRSFVPPRRGEPLVELLLRSLGLAITSESVDSVQGALIILADFELSPGAFAARVAASSGATLHSCIASAMCASSGIRIGRLYAEVEDFLSGAVSRRALLARAAEHQRRGLAVPGFNHPHYPQGDPRAAFILERSRRQLRSSKRLDTIHAFIDAAAELGLLPRHELALVALCIALDMPARCAGALFTLARTTGWVAHVQEQRLSPTLLRPRAQFVGAPARASAYSAMSPTG